MKNKYKIIIIITFLFNTNLKAQVPDTLSYLNSIVNNKTQYLGQHFSYLVANLQINIKEFTPIGANHHEKNKETDTYFSFFYPLSINEYHSSFPKLGITWQIPLNAIQSSILYTMNDGGKWLPNISAFYDNAIIADIRVLE